MPIPRCGRRSAHDAVDLAAVNADVAEHAVVQALEFESGTMRLRMISNFSQGGYLIPRLPHPRSCFLSRRSSSTCSATISFRVRASRRSSVTSLLVAARAVSPASRRLPASRNSLRPTVIEALGDTFPPAQLGNAELATQAVQNNADLLLQPNIACASPGGCPSPAARTAHCSCWISVSSLIPQGYDEPEILPSSRR